MTPLYQSKEDYEETLAKHLTRLAEFQTLHYASQKNALLLIFQGMDGSGKDGTIKHVMSGINPQGCQVSSFKHPSGNELQHDFLWRTTQELPTRGQIGIFNRSYYEEVLIARVHPEILKGEGMDESVPPRVGKKDFWEERYRSIHNFERHLHHNGTKVIKFFLHLSKDEQKERFLDRIDKPEKNWKLTADDIKERAYWDDYQKAYEACLTATSNTKAPWYTIPADDKLNARLLVSGIVLDYFQNAKLHYPKTDLKHREALKSIRKQLLKE